jgi:PmbA protein
VTDPSPDGSLADLAGRVADQARPGEQLEVYAARGATTAVKAYQGEVESLTSARSEGVGIRVVVDGRQGFAHCGTLDVGVVAETLAEARDNVRFGEPDPWFGVAAPDGVDRPELDLWDEGLAALATQAKVDLALALERAVLGRDPRVTGVRTAAYGDSAGEAAVATSTGIAAHGRGTWCHLSVAALATDGDETKVGGGVDVGRGPDELDVEVAAADAVERAVRLFGAVKPASERLTVVLEPRLAATIVGILGGTLSGERVLKGRSPFADRVGEAIASPLLTLVDDPTDGRSYGADPFDGEGLATRRNALVVDGVLQGFLHNSYTGRRSGTASTGSAVRSYRSTPGVGPQALAVAPGRGTLDELVADVGRGLLVQSLTGLHSGVNPVSGDVSVGAEGLLIRDGTLAEPVREITLATTLQRLLLDLRAVGDDVEWLPGGTSAVTLVVDDVSMGGR